MLAEKTKDPDYLWVTPSGVVSQIDNKGKVFSNEDFVNTVLEDTSAAGYTVSSLFHSPMTITLSQGIPDSWVQWGIGDTPGELYTLCEKTMSSHPRVSEIPAEDRLWVPQREQSTRLRDTLPFAGFRVTPRGVKPLGLPESLGGAIVNTVYTVYCVVEKNSIASLKSRDKVGISTKRRQNLKAVYDIISLKNDVTDVLTIASYAEPSATSLFRLYNIYTVIGRDSATQIINDLYYGFFEDQLHSVEEMLSTYF